MPVVTDFSFVSKRESYGLKAKGEFDTGSIVKPGSEATLPEAGPRLHLSVSWLSQSLALLLRKMQSPTLKWHRRRRKELPVAETGKI